MDYFYFKVDSWSKKVSSITWIKKFSFILRVFQTWNNIQLTGLSKALMDIVRGKKMKIYDPLIIMQVIHRFVALHGVFFIFFLFLYDSVPQNGCHDPLRYRVNLFRCREISQVLIKRSKFINSSRRGCRKRSFLVSRVSRGKKVCGTLLYVVKIFLYFF